MGAAPTAASAYGVRGYVNSTAKQKETPPFGGANLGQLLHLRKLQVSANLSKLKRPNTLDRPFSFRVSFLSFVSRNATIVYRNNLHNAGNPMIRKVDTSISVNQGVLRHLL